MAQRGSTETTGAAESRPFTADHCFPGRVAGHSKTKPEGSKHPEWPLPPDSVTYTTGWMAFCEAASSAVQLSHRSPSPDLKAMWRPGECGGCSLAVAVAVTRLEQKAARSLQPDPLVSHLGVVPRAVLAAWQRSELMQDTIRLISSNGDFREIDRNACVIQHLKLILNQ